VKGFALALAMLALVGCQSSAGSSSASPTHVATSTSSPAPGKKPPSQTTSAAIPSWSGSTIFTDGNGYKWKITWTFSAAAASNDSAATINDKPGWATIELPTSGTISVTNLSGRNAPASDEFDITALYPASNPFCQAAMALTAENISVKWAGKSHHDCYAVLLGGLLGGNADLTPNEARTYQNDWWGSYTPPGDLYLVQQSKERSMIADINATGPQLLVIADASGGDGMTSKCGIPVSLNGAGGDHVLTSDPAVSGLSC
jgi:hypothetical protein